jgi:hypothetical protein
MGSRRNFSGAQHLCCFDVRNAFAQRTKIRVHPRSSVVQPLFNVQSQALPYWNCFAHGRDRSIVLPEHGLVRNRQWLATDLGTQARGFGLVGSGLLDICIPRSRCAPAKTAQKAASLTGGQGREIPQFPIHRAPLNFLQASWSLFTSGRLVVKWAAMSSGRPFFFSTSVIPRESAASPHNPCKAVKW